MREKDKQNRRDREKRKEWDKRNLCKGEKATLPPKKKRKKKTYIQEKKVTIEKTRYN